MGYAFISYSSKQQKEADRLKLMLHENGIEGFKRYAASIGYQA